jgi:aspartyl-tRNA(Asn)/glutamyl-tRNA(Gln) amidotransferase subunit A
MKPSFGLVPNYPPGVFDTLNSNGPLSRTVRDAALVLNVIAGWDVRDWYSLPSLGIDYLDGCRGGIRGLRVAWSPDLGYAEVDPEVRRVTEAAALRFAELGCEVEERSPEWADPAEIFHILGYGLQSRIIEDLWEEWGSQMDPGFAWVVEVGRHLSAADVSRAIEQRSELQQAAARFFQRYDLLLTPTMTLPPFPVGISYPRAVAGRPVRGMQWTAFTFPFNLTGQPAATIPCGWTADGLPVGIQVIGGYRNDAAVLRACAAFEQIAPWAHRRPTVDLTWVAPEGTRTTEVGTPSPF